MIELHVTIVTTLLIGLVATETNLPITNSWYDGFQAEGCISITKELNGWTGHIIFSEEVHSIDIWVAVATKITSRDYRIENQHYNAHLTVGDQLCISLVGAVTGNVVPIVTAYIDGMDAPGNTQAPATPTPTPGPVTQTPAPSQATANPTSSPITSASSTNKDYADALTKSILFYNAQRSGKLPANNPISWRGDSALSDCVVGGWYDAGDHVKFGLPMASTATVLLWSLYAFKDGYIKAGQLENMYDMIKWPLDYFLRAWTPTTKKFVVQVGDANADHSFWGRPEDMTMGRPCQDVNPSSPGSDVAAEAAAALAVGSIVFKDSGQTTYSSQLLTAAESLYAFAKSSRGWFTGAHPFYTPSGDQDELCVAGVWLYRATRNSQYLSDARGYADSGYSWAYSWDDKKAACNQLLYEETQSGTYRSSVTSFFQHWLPGGDVTYTPCGLAWRDKWGANRYAGNAAFLALVSAKSGVNTAQYRTWAVEQINYLLGDNKHAGGCFSFEIGHGKHYPQQPHHRAASCPNRPAACGDAQLNIDAPSPHILNGALVGGPDQGDNYVDRRTDYVQNEVATDYNSGFQGALAAINHLQATNNFPKTNNKCPCNS